MYSWSGQFSTVAGSCSRASLAKLSRYWCLISPAQGSWRNSLSLTACPFFPLFVFIHCSIIFYDLLYVLFLVSRLLFLHIQMNSDIFTFLFSSHPFNLGFSPHVCNANEVTQIPEGVFGFSFLLVGH